MLPSIAEPRAFARFLRLLHHHEWIVDLRKPFGGPEHVLHYLARYTHRVAISNHRLIGMEDGKVTFRWKDYAHGGKKRKMTLAAEESIRRFLLHVLPKGLVRIRYYGWMANRRRRECAAKCRALLAAEEPPAPAKQPDRRCPRCGGPVEAVEVVVPRTQTPAPLPATCTGQFVATPSSWRATRAGAPGCPTCIDTVPLLKDALSGRAPRLRSRPLPPFRDTLRAAVITEVYAKAVPEHA